MFKLFKWKIREIGLSKEEHRSHSGSRPKVIVYLISQKALVFMRGAWANVRWRREQSDLHDGR